MDKLEGLNYEIYLFVLMVILFKYEWFGKVVVGIKSLRYLVEYKWFVM